MIYELKVSLKEIRPQIWRLIQVPSDTNLRRMHKILQKAMGWENYHLYVFIVDGNKYSEPNSDWHVMDSRMLTLNKIFAGGKKSFQYDYDMGDGWEHEITLKKQIESDITRPSCIGGARACPPEDCGGVPGYYQFLEAIADPKNPEHDTMLEWVGGSYDPKAFDMAKVDRALKRIR
jgi:hypothetical protein